MAEPLRTDPLRDMLIPESTPPAEGSRLTPGHVDVNVKEPWEARIEELGSEAAEVTQQALGAIDSAVDRARQTAGEMKQRFEVIRGRVESGEFQEEVKKRAIYVADQAARQVQEARRRVKQYSRNEPLKFIAGVAIAGFAVGFLLRMWSDE